MWNPYLKLQQIPPGFRFHDGIVRDDWFEEIKLPEQYEQT